MLVMVWLVQEPRGGTSRLEAEIADRAWRWPLLEIT